MSEFELSKISDFGDIVTGSTPPTNNSLYWNGDYNFYSPADFNDNAYCEKTDKTITKLGLSQGREIPQDSIMVTCIASIGKIAINKSIGLTNQQINTIIPFDKYDFKYIYYLLSHNTAKIKGIAAQTTIPILNKTDFGKFQLLATKDKLKQQQIAQILTNCDTVIEQTQAAIEKYKAIKQGMLHDLFTRGLTASGQLRPTPQQAPELYKQSELGLIPKEWEVKKLEEIGNIITGSTPSTTNLSFWNGKYPFYSPADFSESLYCNNTERNLSELGLHQGRIIQKDTVMVACIASIGKIAISSELGITNQQINSIEVFKEYDFLFLFYLLFKYSDRIKNIAPQTTIPIINKSDFSKLKFAFPMKKSDQIEISDRIYKIEQRIIAEKEILNKYQSIKKGLMSDLLSGKREV